MGPMSNFKQLEIIEKNIKLTIEQGGKLKCGGKRHSFSNEGYYFPPSSKLTSDKFSAEFFIICLAVSGPPVNAIFSTRL